MRDLLKEFYLNFNAVNLPIIRIDRSERMKKYLTLSALIIGFLFNQCGPKVTSQSSVDTPEYHFRSGMRYLDQDDFTSAMSAFQQSVDLDKKFSPGWAGLGLSTGLNGDLGKGRDFIKKAINLDKKNPQIHVFAGRLWTASRNENKKWLKMAEKSFQKALDLKSGDDAANFYLGMAYLYSYNFTGANGQFAKVVENKGDYAGKADEKWALSQKIVRAHPGTPEGEKIALIPKITRADLSVLLVEELKISELIEKFSSQNRPGFQTPAQMVKQKSTSSPPDVTGTWAERWISESIELGVMEPSADGKFYPADPITRAEYARAVAKIISIVTRSTNLGTRYFGEVPSRFSDVPSSHYAYPAMALCAERGIMKIELTSGRFNPTGTVGGADALLIIRELQSSLRMTF
tara:strand:+ start:5488 stop:6699 length:1212 start_codon:yes stop_codon:yes gene_type:complete